MKSLLSSFLWFALVALCLNGALAEASAQDSAREPLWQLAIRQVKKSQNLAASRVVTQITVRDGDDVFLGSIESVDVTSAQNKNPLIWVNVSKKSVGSPGITMELNLHLEDDPGSVLDGYATWADQGMTLLNGRPVALWKGVADPAEAGHALVYLDPDTARPVQVDLVLPVHSNFGTRLVSVTVSFGPGPGDTWVPVSAVIDQSGRFIFWKRHLIITKSFQGWAVRGSTTLATGPAE